MLQAKSQSPFNRLAKDGYINGRSTPFLVVQIKDKYWTSTTIKGLDMTYIQYSLFVGKEIRITEWEDIHINGTLKKAYFQSLLLTDYSQNRNFEWATYKSKFTK